MGARASTDTRLLLAGIAASLALVVYLSVAFADTHASALVTAPSLASEVAPWTPYGSKLLPGSRSKGGGHVVRVSPARVEPGTWQNYGAIVPTLVSQPPSGGRFVVGLWLKGALPRRVGIDQIAVEVDEFRPGATSVTVVKTTVPATSRWHHYTFRGRVKGQWLGLGLAVYRSTNGSVARWFAVRNLTVSVRSR